jgi:hypothetical protein
MPDPLRRTPPFLAKAIVLLVSGLLPACAAHPRVGPSARGFALSGYEPAALALEGDEFTEPPGSSSTLPPEPDAETLQRAQRAEAGEALQAAWALVSTTDAPGTEWEFRFWSHGGALTLLSLRRTEEGGGRAAPVSRGAFLKRFEQEFPTLLGLQPREVTLTLERGEIRWSSDLDISSQDSPPTYARTLPSARGSASQEKYQRALDMARNVARLMTVPRGGSARLGVLVTLEDERIVGWEPGVLNSSGSGPAILAPEEAVTTLLGALLPFTRGLGERTVALTLLGEHSQGEARPRWLVVDARTLEPPPPPPEVADFHKEYRALHEHIIFEFQEQTREYAIQAASFTAEQIAYTVVGGMLLKGIVATLRVAAPTVTAMLAQGGKGAVRWFRTLLVRAGSQEQALLRQLWLKAETQGFSSLTAAEKQQLRALMGRLEKVLSTPLDQKAKRDLWKAARIEYFELHHPELAKRLGAEGLGFYQVHHLCPMEYAHLFPRLNINSATNLAGVHADVHASINAVWGSMRGVSARMRPQDVERVMEIVNRHYRRWFDKVFDPKDASALTTAQKAALAELAELRALLAL